ncbi:MAG: hypothetical protein ABGY09_04015 [Euryarchaeota archaeon]
MEVRALVALLLALMACAVPAAGVNEEFEDYVRKVKREPIFQGEKLAILYQQAGFTLVGRIKVEYLGLQEREVDVGESIRELLRFADDVRPVAETIAKRYNKPELKRVIDLATKHRDVLERLADRLRGKRVRIMECVFHVDMWKEYVSGNPPRNLPSALRELVNKGSFSRDYAFPYPELHLYVLAGSRQLDDLTGLPIRLGWSYEYPDEATEVSVDPGRREVRIRTVRTTGGEPYNLVVVTLSYRGSVLDLLQKNVRDVKQALKVLEDTEVRFESRPRGGEIRVRGLPLWANKGAAVVLYFAGTNPINGIVASRAAAMLGENPKVFAYRADVRAEAHGRDLVIQGGAPGGLLVVYGVGVPGNRLQASSTVNALDLAERLGAVRFPPLIGWLLRLILRPLAGSVTFCYAPSFQGRVTIGSRGLPVWLALIGPWLTRRPRRRRGSAAA